MDLADAVTTTRPPVASSLFQMASRHDLRGARLEIYGLRFWPISAVTVSEAATPTGTAEQPVWLKPVA